MQNRRVRQRTSRRQNYHRQRMHIIEKAGPRGCQSGARSGAGSEIRGGLIKTASPASPARPCDYVMRIG